MPNDPSTPPRASRRLRTVGLIALLLAGGAVVAGAVTRSSEHHEAQQWSDARSVLVVHLTRATPGAASTDLTLPGTMEAWNTAKLFAQVNGYVKSWDKDIGAKVGAGAALGVIETPEVDQQLLQARADLARAQSDASLAQSTADRWNDLLSSASVSKQEADEKNSDLANKKAMVAAAQANLGRLQAMKAFSTIRAPFAGVVTARNAEIGNLVGPNNSGQPLFAVDDTHAIRVYVSVPQAYSASVKPGLQAALTLPDFPGRTFTAHLIGDAGAIDPQTGTFRIQLIADNPDGSLRPGGYAQVTFRTAATVTSTVMIPSSALIFRAHNTQVATVGPGNRVKIHDVTVGHDLGETLEIASGLAANARVVRNPPDSISDGQQVQLDGSSRG